jgi:hypothetical protein
MGIRTYVLLVCAFLFTSLCPAAHAEDPPDAKAKGLERAKASVIKYLQMPKDALFDRVKSGYKLCANAGSMNCSDPVFALGLREDVTADDKARILSAQLQSACEVPADIRATPESKRNLTTYKKVIVEGMFLAGPGVAAHLEKELAAQGRSGECRPWLVVALAYHDSRRAVIPELLRQSVESEDFNIRAASVRAFHRGVALESMSAKDIRPYLEKWLNDPYHTDGTGSDVKFPAEHADWNITYPVRDEALSVLLKKKIPYTKHKHDYVLIE